MLTKELKQSIIKEIKERRKNFDGSDSKFALSLGISAAIYSRIQRGEVDKVLSQENWISLARKFNISLKGETPWNTANTPVFEHITGQLTKCQEDGISAIICDSADIGKTFTAKIYVKTHRNAVYVDCSLTKSKQRLIRFIAKEYGVGYTGRY
ncbi:MAG: helix-turn-helix transcriptional regulator, partial [Bacteroidota bacterium]